MLLGPRVLMVVHLIRNNSLQLFHESPKDQKYEDRYINISNDEVTCW